MLNASQQRKVFLDSPIVVSYQGTNYQHDSVFDLIGWIFSVSGPSPPRAGRSNYYYPLIALYCVFCRKAAPKIENEPKMVQITWFAQNRTPRLCIGANLDKPGFAIKDAARKRRGQYMVDARWLTSQERDTWTNVPLPSGSLPQLAGHCAESLPFLYIQS